MNKTRSAGAILINSEGKIALVNNRGKSWTFPKGHIEVGESAEQAMFREVTEETGIRDFFALKQLGEYERPTIPSINSDVSIELKHITMFLCLTDESELQPIDPENPEAKWVDPDEVYEMLTHKLDKEFYEEVKTEASGIGNMNRKELLEALDLMSFNEELANRQPAKEEEFRAELLYNDPNIYEDTKALYESYGYKYNHALWKIQQLQYILAYEAEKRRLNSKK